MPFYAKQILLFDWVLGISTSSFVCGHSFRVTHNLNFGLQSRDLRTASTSDRRLTTLAKKIPTTHYGWMLLLLFLSADSQSGIPANILMDICDLVNVRSISNIIEFPALKVRASPRWATNTYIVYSTELTSILFKKSRVWLCEEYPDTVPHALVGLHEILQDTFISRRLLLPYGSNNTCQEYRNIQFYKSKEDSNHNYGICYISKDVGTSCRLA